MNRTTVVGITFVATILAVIPPPAARANDAVIVTGAAKTLEDMAADPNSGIPQSLLKASEGVVLVPNLINASFVFGVKIGRGVFMVKDSKGRWGNPVHVFISGGTVGLQAGGQSTELVMVFRTKESVNRLLAGKGKITLGVDAGVAAGPSGKNVGAETDLEMRAEILTYAKSRGLFAGASLGGTGITVDRNKNAIYYDNFAVTTFQIVEGDSVSVPPEAARLKAILTAITNPPKSKKKSEADGDDDDTIEPRVSRSTKVNRRAGEDAEDEDAPYGRTSTRRRRPAGADDDLNDDPPPRQARANPSRRPSGADEPDDLNDDPPAVKMKPVRRAAPTNPDDLDNPLPDPKPKPRTASSGN